MQQKDLIQKASWDNLIVLDACRYDVFSKLVVQSKLNGKLLKLLPDVINTKEWYKLNFGKKNNDIILVTGHPHPYWFKENFYRTIFLKKNWLKPEETLKEAVRIQEVYPKKRKLIHLVQPHIPFIGEEGRKLSEELDLMPESWRNLGGTTAYDRINKFAKENGFERLWKCYTENLEIALRVVEEYIGKLKGSKVITADHGETIGEGGKYRHNCKEVKKIPIPWFRCERS